MPCNQRHCKENSLKRGGQMANPLLQHYIKLTEFLGQALGPDYEVALHDMTDKNRSIVAIANNHISGREIGAPLTNVALKILMDKSYETHNGKLVGMLCINFDDSRYLAASENVLRLCHPDIFIDDHIAPQQAEPGDPFPRAVPATTESFHNSIDAVAGDAVGRELIRLGVTADRLTPDERMQIIASLENGGIFLLKGAVKDVADALHCSQASVYRYLSQIKKDDSNSASE